MMSAVPASRRRAAVPAAVSLLLAAAAAAAQTTRPPEAFETDPLDAASMTRTTGGQVLLHFRSGVPVPRMHALREALGALWWRPAGGGSAARLSLGRITFAEGVGTADIGINHNADPSFPEDQLLRQAVDRLNALVSATADLTEEERRRQLQQIRIELEHTLPPMEKELTELQRKASAVRRDEQELARELAGRTYRQQALEEKISRLRKEAEVRKDRDPVVEELRKIEQIKKRELERSESLYKTGHASSSDRDQKETELAEIKIRIAERAAAIAKAGKGEILDRLADELILLSVDVTEMELRLADLRRQLAALDPQKAKLDLQKQRRDLLQRELALSLEKAALPAAAEASHRPQH